MRACVGYICDSLNAQVCVHVRVCLCKRVQVLTEKKLMSTYIVNIL